EGGIYLRAHEVCSLLAVVAGEPELLRAPRDRGAEDRIRGRRAAEGAHLLERALDEKVRRDDLQRRIVPQPLGLLIEDQRKGTQPREICFGILLHRDPMLAIEEGRDALVRTRELAEDVRATHIAVGEWLAAGDSLHLELDGVVVGPVGTAQ